MKRILPLLVVFLIAGCATPQPSIYDPASYRKLSWADKPFEQINARCKHTSMRHVQGDLSVYEVRRPLYKACMEHFGYRYVGKMEVIRNDAPKPLVPTSDFEPSPQVMNLGEPVPIEPVIMPDEEINPPVVDDKSALYR